MLPLIVLISVLFFVAVLSGIVIYKITKPTDDNGLIRYDESYNGNIIRYTQGGKQRR